MPLGLFLSNVLELLVQRSYTYFVEFIPKYLTFFDALVNYFHLLLTCYHN